MRGFKTHYILYTFNEPESRNLPYIFISINENFISVIIFKNDR